MNWWTLTTGLEARATARRVLIGAAALAMAALPGGAVPARAASAAGESLQDLMKARDLSEADVDGGAQDVHADREATTTTTSSPRAATRRRSS